MTKAQIKVLEAIFKFGIVTVLPNSNEHKAANKMARQFGWIERETVVFGEVVYQYRPDTI
jgi:hypothetical protein